MSGVGEESIRRITKTQEAPMRRWAGVRGPNDQSDIMKNLLISGQVSVFAKVLIKLTSLFMVFTKSAVSPINV